MKDYIGQMATDDLNDAVLNPAWPEQARDISAIKKIVVHHEAQEEGSAYDDDSRYEAEAHYQNDSSIPGSRGLQYHFKIDNVGLINWVRPLTEILWHAGNLEVNNESIGICLDGNFETQSPTREQFEALKQLLDWLCTEHPEFPAVQGDVYAHREVIDQRYFPGGTACPGQNLYPFVLDYRNTGGKPVMPDVAYQHPELQSQGTPPLQTSSPTDHQPVAAAAQPEPVPTVSATEAPGSVAPTPPVTADVRSDDPSNPSLVSEHSSNPITTVEAPQHIITTGEPMNKLKSRKLWLTVATWVAVIAGAAAQYFSSTQTATLLGLITAVYVSVQGKIDAQ